MTADTQNESMSPVVKFLKSKTFGAIFGVVAVAGMIAYLSNEVNNDNTEETTATTTSEEPTTATVEKKDAMPWLEKQMGGKPAEYLTQDPSLWYGYVNGAYFESGSLYVQLQVDRKEDKALGQQAAKALSNLVGLSSDPEVADIDGHAVVEDGAGVYIAQEMIERR